MEREYLFKATLASTPLGFQEFQGEYSEKLYCPITGASKIGLNKMETDVVKSSFPGFDCWKVPKLKKTGEPNAFSSISRKWKVKHE